MSSNFDFMKEINKQYYADLTEIEKNARIRPKEAAKSCRTLLESFIEELLKKYNIGKEDSLYKNIGKLEDRQKIPRLGLTEYEAIDMEGNVSRIKIPRLHFVRNLANAASHEGLPTKKGDKKAVISTEAVVEALRTYHELFYRHYRNRLNGKKPQFYENRIPLGRYDASSSYVPVDTERSKCVKEYLASRKTGEFSREVRYALIREYLPSDMDSLFLNRNLDAFSESYKYTYSNGVTVEKLNEINEPYANFFIAYEFPRQVTPLAVFLKKNKISMKNRVWICQRIAQSLYKFHNAANPIYHRMLTYECIVISDFTEENEGYMPYITKFDFAKITSITEGTVFNNLSEAEAKESLKLSRYKLDAVTPDSPWDKVDIYSLGVLFIDVMQNNISTKAVTGDTFEELIEAGITDNMIDIIDEMLCDIPEERPGIQQVLEAVNKELRLYE